MIRTLPALALAIALSALPAAAQEAVPEETPGEIDEGLSLLEEGAKLLLRGLMSQVEPTMRDMAEGMEQFAENAGPMLRDLARMMGDIANYHPPEMLPNGDIIIRRRAPLEPLPEDEIEI